MFGQKMGHGSTCTVDHCGQGHSFEQKEGCRGTQGKDKLCTQQLIMGKKADWTHLEEFGNSKRC